MWPAAGPTGGGGGGQETADIVQESRRGGDALFPEKKSGWDFIPWSPGLPETTGKVVRESRAAAWGSAFLDRKLEAGLPRSGQSLEQEK